MIELPWNAVQPIDRHVLRTYVDTMIRRSEMSDVFAILMPLTVYIHIKSVGINAELIELPNSAGHDMVWIKVSKIRKQWNMKIEAEEENAEAIRTEIESARVIR